MCCVSFFRGAFVGKDTKSLWWFIPGLDSQNIEKEFLGNGERLKGGKSVKRDDGEMRGAKDGIQIGGEEGFWGETLEGQRNVINVCNGKGRDKGQKEMYTMQNIKKANNFIGVRVIIKVRSGRNKQKKMAKDDNTATGSYLRRVDLLPPSFLTLSSFVIFLFSLSFL